MAIIAHRLLYHGPSLTQPHDNPLCNAWVLGVDIERLFVPAYLDTSVRPFSRWTWLNSSIICEVAIEFRFCVFIIPSDKSALRFV